MSIPTEAQKAAMKENFVLRCIAALETALVKANIRAPEHLKYGIDYVKLDIHGRRQLREMDRKK